MSQTLEPKEANSSNLNPGLAGKYLTFCLGHEYYGISVLKIREIIRMLEVTPVPQMPQYVRGVINLRGKIIPVIDLRMRFQLAEAQTHERTCIIVVQIDLPSGDKTQMGMVVDAVEEVVLIAPGDLEGTPNFGSQLRADYILGLAKIKGKVKTLLDIDKVIAADALASLTSVG